MKKNVAEVFFFFFLESDIARYKMHLRESLIMEGFRLDRVNYVEVVILKIERRHQK